MRVFIALHFAQNVISNAKAKHQQKPLSKTSAVQSYVKNSNPTRDKP
jgi:hypothetical protein